MTVAYVGELTLEAALPGVVAPLFAAYADVQAKATALADFVVALGLPPMPITAQLVIAEGIVASLTVAIQLGITPPNLSAQLSIAAAALAQIEAALAVLSGLFSLLTSGGVFAYTFDGATNAFGSEMTSALASGFPGHVASTHANVLVLGTVSGATWTAMSQVFKTS